MYIKELYLTSFGKFNQKQIRLEKGLNIIYGENEAGKSTIHKFIESIFFGFFKENKSKRMYNSDYNKYLPLYGENYGGTLIFCQDGQEIRIERNLIKGKDNVILYDNVSGEDITNNFWYDKTLKLPVPFNLSKMNRTIYNNTVNISQLSNATQKEMAHEIEDKLANYGGSKTDISVNNAIKNLEAKQNDMGTEKRKGTLLYNLNRRWEYLQSEKEKSLSNEKKIQDCNNQKINEEKEIESILNKINLLDKNLQGLKCKNAQKKLNEYEALSSENKQYSKQLSRIKFKDVNIKDYTDIISIENNIEVIKDNYDEAQKKIQDLSVKINELKFKFDNYSSTGNNKILIDHNELQYLVNEKTNVISKKKEYDAFQIKELLKELNTKQKSLDILKFAALLGGIIGLMGGFWKSIIFVLSSLLLLSGYFLIKARENKNKINNLTLELSRILDNERELDKQINNLDEQIRDILIPYGCSNFSQFIKNIMGKYQEDKISWNSIQNDMQVLVQSRRNLIENINNYKDKLLKYNKRIKCILENNGVNSKEEFYRSIKEKDEKEVICNKININIDLMNRIINENEYESIKQMALKYELMSNYIIIDNEEQLKKEIKDIEDKLNFHKSEKYRLEGILNNIISINTPLSEIETEIETVKKKIEQINEKNESINLAINVIDKISSEIHNQLAPEINETFGFILNKITNKYSKVKVTKDFSIRVEDPDNNRLLDLGYLSLGTLDQVYFAFRLGLNSFINGDSYPLIMDEAFIQYDDNRLKNVLNFLMKQSKNRQIILFTSQLREQKIFQSLGEDMHFINLNENERIEYYS